MKLVKNKFYRGSTYTKENDSFISTDISLYLGEHGGYHLILILDYLSEEEIRKMMKISAKEAYEGLDELEGIDYVFSLVEIGGRYYSEYGPYTIFEEEVEENEVF